MKMTTKCHIKVLSQTMELLILGSIIALVADIGWVFKDIYHNGISASYIVIAFGLNLALFITIYAGYKHHTANVKCEIKSVLTEKLTIQKARNKDLRKHPERRK